MRRHRILKILSALFVLLLLAGLVAWLFPQQILTEDSGPVTADAMVVLGGFPDRAIRAAELFKQGEAPEVLVSGSGDSTSNMRLLERDGVTNAHIIVENRSRTTRENAEFSIPLLRQISAHRVIIVTSWYHSRRALACFEHYAPDIQFYSRPSYHGYGAGTEDGRPNADNGKMTFPPTLSPFEADKVRTARKAERKRIRHYADSEYVKLLGYWVFYGVCPI
jgi:uncharacterized SAM-binding protein YcdF (DUF218 family)